MTTIPMAGGPTPAAPNQAAGGSLLTPEMKQKWDTLVQSNDLVLFMKGTPDAPQCGFSNRAAQALAATEHPFHTVNVLAEGSDPFTTMRALAEWADFPTLPQVWVKGELIGGSDVAAEMVQNGELLDLLKA